MGSGPKAADTTSPRIPNKEEKCFWRGGYNVKPFPGNAFPTCFERSSWPPRAPKAPSVPCVSPWLPAPGVQLRPRPLRPGRRNEAIGRTGIAASAEALRFLPVAAARGLPVHGRADERSPSEAVHQSGRSHRGGIDNRAPSSFAPESGDLDGGPRRGIQSASHVFPNAVSRRPVAGARDQGWVCCGTDGASMDRSSHAGVPDRALPAERREERKGLAAVPS